MKSHRKHPSRKHHSSQEGYISTDLKKIMSRNEKIVMGVLIGGIVVFLILSIVLIFGKGRQPEVAQNPLPQAPSKERLNTTPYPTIPPITDMTVMVNERRLNPVSVTIKRGNKISFLNIGAKDVTVEGTDANSSFLNFSVPSADSYDYTFKTPGVYNYRIKGTSLVGTITIE